MKTNLVFSLLAAFMVATLLPAFSAAQSLPTPASTQATSSQPRLQRWFVSAPLRQAPNANALKAVAEEAVANCYQSAIDIVALASGDKENSRRNGSYAADRERAGIAAVKSAGGVAVTAQSRFTGVGDEHGRGVELRCAYPSPGPQGPAGQAGASGYDGANCYDGLSDMNGDGDINVLDCRVSSENPDNTDLRFTLGAAVLADLVGEYNRFGVGLSVSPAWQKGAFVLRGIFDGTVGNGDAFSSKTVEGFAALVAGAQVSDHFELGAGSSISGVYGQEKGIYNREFRFGGLAAFTGRWSRFEMTAGVGIVREQDQKTGHAGLALQPLLNLGIVIGAE